MGRTKSMLINIRCKFADARNRTFRTNHQLARLLAAEGILFNFILVMAHNNNNLYASRLGATATQLGLMASLPPIIGMLTLIPFAVITDRLHNKKPMVMLSAIGLGFIYILVGMVAFLDAYRLPFLIILLVLANVPLSLYNSSWQAFFSDVSLPADRNLIYTHRTRMNTVVNIVAPLIAGAILTAASGSGKILVHQIYYWLAFPLAVGQVFVLRKINGGNAHEVNHVDISALRESARILFHSRKFLGFLGVALIVYCGWEMDWSLYFVAQLKFLHLNEAQMSMMAVLGSGAQFLTMGLWSRLVQKKGVRFVFFIGASGLAVCGFAIFVPLLLPLTLRLPFYFVIQTLGSATFSAFQLSLFQCLLEVIPNKNRAISISFYNTIILMSNAVMPFTGIYLYKLLGESIEAMIIAFVIITVIRIAGTAAALFRWYRLKNDIDTIF